MVLQTVRQKVTHIIMVLLLAGMLFSPVVADPVLAGDCPNNGSTSC